MVLRGAEAARRVRARGVLDIFAVLGNQSRRQLEELLSELGSELRPNQVLDWLLLL